MGSAVGVDGPSAVVVGAQAAEGHLTELDDLAVRRGVQARRNGAPRSVTPTAAGGAPAVTR